MARFGRGGNYAETIRPSWSSSNDFLMEKRASNVPLKHRTGKLKSVNSTIKIERKKSF